MYTYYLLICTRTHFPPHLTAVRTVRRKTTFPNPKFPDSSVPRTSLSFSLQLSSLFLSSLTHPLHHLPALFYALPVLAADSRYSQLIALFTKTHPKILASKSIRLATRQASPHNRINHIHAHINPPMSGFTQRYIGTIPPTNPLHPLPSWL